ncbi:MAG TPA: D-2-hydroxyacid dehydrogenase [Gemmataceae bacterium]|nr:D-2-hydroxyacid dehydrogenase [Gemmataceae bacterium]
MARILSDIPLDETAVRRLEALPGVTVQQLPPHDKAWELAGDLLRGPAILLCKLPPTNFGDMPDLKLIQISTVGYEHLRPLRLGDRPLRVCNARGLFDTAIAEWNLAMMVNLVRDVPGMLRNQQHAVWQRASRFQQELRGSCVGLWGYGGIGRATARLAKAFGMTVHAMTRTGVRPRHNDYAEPGTGDPDGMLPDRVFVADQEQEFLAGLDFLVLALPHTQQSGGMVGEQQLRALPPTAFVLNPARGPIIQEQPLLRALREGWIAGAALDTHFAYPLPADHPLWRFPNVILTPHISGADKSRLFPGRVADLFVQNVARFLDGRPLLNELTPQEWAEA